MSVPYADRHHPTYGHGYSTRRVYWPGTPWKEFFTETVLVADVGAAPDFPIYISGAGLPGGWGPDRTFQYLYGKPSVKLQALIDEVGPINTVEVIRWADGRELCVGKNMKIFLECWMGLPVPPEERKEQR